MLIRIWGYSVTYGMQSGPDDDQVKIDGPGARGNGPGFREDEGKPLGAVFKQLEP